MADELQELTDALQLIFPTEEEGVAPCGWIVGAEVYAGKGYSVCEVGCGGGVCAGKGCFVHKVAGM